VGADDQSRIVPLYRMSMLVSARKKRERDATGEAGIEHTKVYCCTPQNLLAFSQRRRHDSATQTTREKISFYR
jgi:hypothetical protein